MSWLLAVCTHPRSAQGMQARCIYGICSWQSGLRAGRPPPFCQSFAYATRSLAVLEVHSGIVQPLFFEVALQPCRADKARHGCLSTAAASASKRRAAAVSTCLRLLLSRLDCRCGPWHLGMARRC